MSHADKHAENFSVQDSLAILPSIFNTLNLEAIDYESSKEAHEFDGCIIEVSFRDRLLINVNCQHEVMIGHDITNTNIKQAIVDFFDNEKIEHVGYNSSRFWSLDDAGLYARIEDTEKRINRILETEKVDEMQSLLDYYKEELMVYNRYALYKKVLMLDNLSISQLYAHVRIRKPKSCEIPERFICEVLDAFYVMRDAESKKHFKQSYANLFWLAKEKNDAVASKKLELLKYLKPVQFKRKVEIVAIPPPPTQ